MTSQPMMLRAACVAALLATAALAPPLAAQGIGANVGVGLYRSLVAASGRPGAPLPEGQAGVGATLSGHWASRSGATIGLGARIIRYPRNEEDRVSLFLDGRYAPMPTAARRTRPVIGLRAGPYLGGGTGDGDGSPLFGIEAAALGGLSHRLGPGVSLTLLADLGLVLATNEGSGARRFHPGVHLGITIH